MKAGSLVVRYLYQTLTKAIDMSSTVAKVLLKSQKEDDQEFDRYGRKSLVERPVRNLYCQSEIRLLEIKCITIFCHE